MIIYLCQTQPITYTGNTNKGGNSPGWFESKHNVGSFAHTSTDIVPSGHMVKDERIPLKSVVNSGNNNQCYMILSLIIAALMLMNHF